MVVKTSPERTRTNEPRGTKTNGLALVKPDAEYKGATRPAATVQGASTTEKHSKAPGVATSLQEAEPRYTQRPNRTGIPDSLKAKVEALSGMSLDDVRVHYNSHKPSRIQARAYTQGTDIYVEKGQERHLPHEAWHVVQQKQQKVKATTRANGVWINDSEDLEREADRMGVSVNRMFTWKAAIGDERMHGEARYSKDGNYKNKTKQQHATIDEKGKWGKANFANCETRRRNDSSNAVVQCATILARDESVGFGYHFRRNHIAANKQTAKEISVARANPGARGAINTVIRGNIESIKEIVKKVEFDDMKHIQGAQWKLEINTPHWLIHCLVSETNRGFVYTHNFTETKENGIVNLKAYYTENPENHQSNYNVTSIAE